MAGKKTEKETEGILRQEEPEMTLQEQEIQEAVQEAHIPEAVIEESGREEEHPARMLLDDFDWDNPIDYVHPDDEIRLKWEDVRMDAARQRIKNCEVLGCARLPSGKGMYVTTKINDFKTIINGEEFFLPGTFSANFETASEEDRCSRQMQMAQRMLGAKISVIITMARSEYNKETGERTYAIAASRVAAAEVRKNIHFFGRRSAVRMPRVGDTVAARILLVSDKSVLVEACGIQSRIPFPRMTGRNHLTSSNVLQFFPKDKAVPMIVESIEVDRQARTVEWRLSHRAAEDQIQKTVLDESYIGRNFLGEIIAITDTYYISYCASENVTCSTPINRCATGTRLRHGDKVALRVYGIGGDFLKCNCRKI